MFCVFPSFRLIWKILDDFIALFRGVETLQGEKEKRVLVGTTALHFKPYKISNTPQSQTSN